MGRLHVVKTRELKGAFAAASRGIELPLEHQLIADARLYASQRQYRQAVISACSAAEVALAQSSRASLIRAGRTEAEAHEIVRKVSGVVELFRLNAGRGQLLGVSIGRVMNLLAAPRNEAVHGGEALDLDTAIKSIQTANELLQVSPLKTPRSLAMQAAEL